MLALHRPAASYMASVYCPHCLAGKLWSPLPYAAYISPFLDYGAATNRCARMAGADRFRDFILRIAALPGWLRICLRRRGRWLGFDCPAGWIHSLIERGRKMIFVLSGLAASRRLAAITGQSPARRLQIIA